MTPPHTHAFCTIRSGHRYVTRAKLPFFRAVQTPDKAWEGTVHGRRLTSAQTETHTWPTPAQRRTIFPRPKRSPEMATPGAGEASRRPSQYAPRNRTRAAQKHCDRGTPSPRCGRGRAKNTARHSEHCSSTGERGGARPNAPALPLRRRP